MIKLIRVLLLTTAASALLILMVMALLLLIAVEEETNVERLAVVETRHIERAKRLLDEHRKHKDRHVLNTISILSEDIDIAANYLAKLYANGKARIHLSHRKAEIVASVPVSWKSLTGFINFQATLVETRGLPLLHSVRIGKLVIPDGLTRFITDQIEHRLANHSQYGNGFNSIRQIKFSSDALRVSYRLPESDYGGTENFNLPVLSKAEQAIIYRYHLFLVQNSRQQSNGKTVQNTQPLSQILQSLMQMAAAHSEKNRAPVENRAAILAATFHILRLPLKYFIPEAVDWPRAKYQVITLDGRQDFAQHFIVSAAITAYADTFLSDAIGLYKEIEDARSGSGFSFNDIAADRAGTLFGERATASQMGAMQIQQWASQDITDKDLMPDWQDLPEHLPKPVFRQHYGNMDTPAYHQMMKTIEQRVAVLPFLQ